MVSLENLQDLVVSEQNKGLIKITPTYEMDIDENNSCTEMYNTKLVTTYMIMSEYDADEIINQYRLEPRFKSASKKYVKPKYKKDELIRDEYWLVTLTFKLK